MTEQLLLFDQTSSAEAYPAKTGRWLASVLDWLAAEAGCSSSSPVSSANGPPVGFCSRTSLVFCQQTEGGTLEPFSGRWGNWGMGSLTAFSTLSGLEFPSGAVACSLSDVLETGDVPPKYFLSPKACRGILRRAEKRGRELPEMLRAALERVAEDSPEPENPEDKTA